MDCRDRLEPLVPVTYFANCMGTCVVMGLMAERADLLRQDGIVVVAQLIEDSINGLNDGTLGFTLVVFWG
uniref:Uncharacterized protein n=1 Tax=Nelumbo nucifera TaxID=4432 RepID=A0A822ZWR1_NELNU|nr:TPA_asm: hypothetical protein HUJ06_017712 [Nelumbo nucifera]